MAMALEVDDIVTRCQAAIREATPSLAVRDVLDELITKPAALEHAVGEVERGGIAPLHVSTELTVLRVAWTPGMVLNPHDHQVWAVIGIYGGQEDNTFFRRTPEGLKTSGGQAVAAGDVLVMGDDAVHSVANSRREYAVALHVYGGDFFALGRSEWDWQTLTERPRDVEGTLRLFDEAEDRWRAESG
jgi:predicted metal-dependent enzyme (double-stranded beta helix superfamily)